MLTKTYQLETVTCPSCIVKIEWMLKIFFKLESINNLNF
jgi:hypothetical protein